MEGNILGEELGGSNGKSNSFDMLHLAPPQTFLAKFMPRSHPFLSKMAQGKDG